MAKMLREQAVRERRVRKQERKQERKDNKLAAAALEAAGESATPDTPEPSGAPEEHEGDDVTEAPDAEPAGDEKEEQGVGWPLRAPGQGASP
jgi:hypothetical protein